MSLELDRKHLGAKARASELADRWADRAWEIRSYAVRTGRLHPEFWSEFCSTGHMGMLVPEEFGGSGAGLLALTVALDALATRRIAPVPSVVTNLAASAIARAGSHQLKQRYLPGIVSGQWVFALAFTEAEIGHNAWRMRTQARRAGGVISVNGTKSYISGADLCGRMLVMARSLPEDQQQPDGMPASYGFNAVVVDPAAPGITLENMNLGGVEGLNQFHVRFDDLRVPASQLLGQEHQGIPALFPSLNVERILTSAIGVGITDYLLHASVTRASERAVFGSTPIGRYQAIQHPLAELRAQTEAARLLVYQAAAAYDAKPDTTIVGGYANMAKLLSADLVCKATDQAIRTFGAAAFEPHRGLTDLLLDARIMRNTPISQELALNFIAEQVLDLPRSIR